MPLNFCNMWHDLGNSTSLNSIFNNPVYVAIIIVLIVLIIIFIMFRSEIDESDYSFWTLLFRSGFYLLLPVITIVFMHYKNIENEFEIKLANRKEGGAVDATIGQKIEDTDVFKSKPVLPNDVETILL